LIGSGGISLPICEACARLRAVTPADQRHVGLIKPGDILLIEGRTHIAGVIKYLTQST
jgi:hypothetical protein